MKKIIFYLSLAISAISCEKQVTDLQPIDLIPADRAFQNVNDIQIGVFGVYGSYQNRRSVYINSFISDELRLGTGTEYRNVGNILFNWQHVSDSQDWRDAETGGAWTNLLFVIDRANRVLELGDPVQPVSAAETNLKAQLRGEMLAMRGMALFELLRLFSNTRGYDPNGIGVPIRTTYVKEDSVRTYRSTRAPQNQVIARVLADLAEAKTLIPVSFNNSSRITRTAISALQARVALWTRDWTNAVTFSTEVLTARPVTTDSAAYAAIWSTRTLNDVSNNEVIWKYNIQLANLGQNIGNLFQDNPAGNARQAFFSQKLFSAFDTARGDRRTFLFTRLNPRPLINKYGSSPGLQGTENFQYDIKLLRSSEFLLTRAEANAELGNFTAANADLNALRNARIRLNTPLNITDLPSFITAVLEERFRELCFEGNRYFDLKRRNLNIERPLVDAVLPASQTLQASNPKFILPIPFAETFANPTIQQNPGY